MMLLMYQLQMMRCSQCPRLITHKTGNWQLADAASVGKWKDKRGEGNKVDDFRSPLLLRTTVHFAKAWPLWRNRC